MRTIALLVALAAAACGGTDTKAAEYPATTTTTTNNTTGVRGTDPNATSGTAPVTTGTGYRTVNGPSTESMNTETARATEDARLKESNAHNETATRPATANGSSTTPASNAFVGQNPGSADGTNAADNTKINERDRKSNLTPMDQGNSKEETNVTAAIRKSIVGDKSLSFNAKNVKVITTGTKVTLRGPVKTEQERATIEALAKRAAGVTEVDNQLEVKK